MGTLNPMRTFISLTMLLLWCAGCATYEYDIVRPQELARHIGSQPMAVQVEPLIYHLQSYDNRLVMQVQNPTADPITLLGDQSTAVDPDGQSHPLRSQTIAPGSFIKLILPPIPPRIERSGPSIGIGIGYGRHDTCPTPQYLTVYEDSALYWDWAGQTDAKINLVYERAGQRFAHSFIFARKKM
ncbi:MAG: hypothetical protein IT447_12805 [Phycisphaerales bacterium]|nr:hypothetical protein [Phycisphaerales bacterium]